MSPDWLLQLNAVVYQHSGATPLATNLTMNGDAVCEGSFLLNLEYDRKPVLDEQEGF
jgi:hypothetical protein